MSYLALKLRNMAAKKTEKRGRKPLPAGKKVVPITIYVLSENRGSARAECARIASKYR